MEEFYKNKYLKYKQKYLLSGGVCANCPKIGFEQHHGECWHDSFSTIMLFSDDFSESIQKIFTPDFDAATRIKRVISKPDLYYKYFLPPNINEASGDFDKFIEYAKTYLTNLNKLYQNEVKPLDKRIDGEQLSISCVSRVYDITNINRITFRKFDKRDHAGGYSDNIINSCIYNYFLREQGTKYLILNNFKINEATNEEFKLLLSLLPKCFGILLSLKSIDNAPDSGHATGFFSCKNEQYFFDDNGISDDPKNKKTFTKFSWRQYLTDKINEILKSKDKTFSIISDFFGKNTQKYLENYIIIELSLFISHEETNEDDYYKNNYENLMELTCFSTPKLNSLIHKYIQPDIITRLLFNCVEDNNVLLLKELTVNNKLDLTHYKNIKNNNCSLLFHAIAFANDFNEIIKLLLTFKFDLNEIVIDEIHNYNLFLRAIVNNNIELVKKLLDTNKSIINSVTIDNESGLYLAVLKNSYDMVKLLIDNKIDFTIKKDKTKSPLRLAIEYNIYEANESDYQTYSFNPEISKIKDTINSKENAYLDENKRIIKLLLDTGAGKVEQDLNDLFAYALEFNNLEAVELLLDKKYNLSINLNSSINGDLLISFGLYYNNHILPNLNPKSLLYQIIKTRDDARNEKIFDLILQKKINKKTIQNAIDICKKESKPNISKKFLAIKS